VQVQKQFEGNADVVFVGLTSDGSDAIAEGEQWCAKHGVPWPSLYGAGEAMTGLGIQYIPSEFVIGRDGKVAWNNEQPGGIEQAIEEALAQPAAADQAAAVAP
jgi:hypothetical protein